MVQFKVKHVSTEQQKTQLRITFSTTDKINPLELIQMEKAPGFLYFSPDKVSQEAELAMRDTRIGVDSHGQSGSKKLRAALYEYWFANIKNKDFEVYYNEAIDTFINRINKAI